MGLEAGDYISDLIETNPTPGDKRRQGDDHIRLIKKVLKGTFPLLNGPVAVTPLELNRLSGISNNIMSLLNSKLEQNALTGFLSFDRNETRTKSHACSPVNLGSVSGALSINVSLSEFFIATVVGNISGINFTNVANGVPFRLKLIHGGGGNHTIAWGAQIHFPGKVAPTFTPGLNNYDVLNGFFLDNVLVCTALQNVGVGA
jgi:hypothetical protein